MKFFLISLIISNFAFSQNYGDKDFYLVDSLDLNSILPSGLNTLDSCLTIYHSTEDFKSRIEALSCISENLGQISIWSQYNQLIYDQIESREKKYLTEEDKVFCMRYKNAAVNNFGYINQVKGNITGALKNYYESLQIFKGLKDSIGMAASYNNIGSAYSFQGDVYNCLLSYQQSLQISKEIYDQEGIARSLNNIGIIFYEQGDLTKALTYYNESLEIRQMLGDEVLIATQLNNIGLCYELMNESEIALSYYHKSIDIFRKHDNIGGMAVSLINIGGCHQELKEYSKALEVLTEGLLLLTGSGEVKELGGINIALASVYLDLNDLPKALQLYEEGLAINLEINFTDGICNSYEGLSKCYLELNQPKKAKYYAQKSLDLAQELGYPALIKKSALTLSRVLEETEDYELALEYHKLFKEMNDSIVNGETKNSFLLQQAEFQFNQELDTADKLHEAELDTLSKTAELQTRNMSILIGGLLLILGLVIILVIKLRHNSEQKDIIEQRDFEKSVLLKEIHHRVKNSLQITTSLIRLQKMNLTDENAIRALEDTELRISAIALVHKSIYQNENIDSVSLKYYIEELTNSNLNLTDVKFLVECPELLVKVEIATPLALIISELIANTLKHAFKRIRPENEIRLDVQVLENEDVVLQLTDNGVGLPESFNLEHNDNGLGFEIINALIEQINAEICVVNVPLGASFQIKFKV